MHRFFLFPLVVFCFFFLFSSAQIFAQNNDSLTPKPYSDLAKSVIETALSKGQAYEMLRELTLDIGPRLSGSPEAAAAVEWGRQTMMKLGFDNVHLQEVMVPHWVRGSVETARVVHSSTLGTAELAVCALGGSIGTPELWNCCRNSRGAKFRGSAIPWKRGQWQDYILQSSHGSAVNEYIFGLWRRG